MDVDVLVNDMLHAEATGVYPSEAAAAAVEITGIDLNLEAMACAASPPPPRCGLTGPGVSLYQILSARQVGHEGQVHGGARYDAEHGGGRVHLGADPDKPAVELETDPAGRLVNPQPQDPEGSKVRSPVLADEIGGRGSQPRSQPRMAAYSKPTRKSEGHTPWSPARDIDLGKN